MALRASLHGEREGHDHEHRMRLRRAQAQNQAIERLTRRVREQAREIKRLNREADMAHRRETPGSLQKGITALIWIVGLAALVVVVWAATKAFG